MTHEYTNHDKLFAFPVQSSMKRMISDGDLHINNICQESRDNQKSFRLEMAT